MGEAVNILRPPALTQIFLLGFIAEAVLQGTSHAQSLMHTLTIEIDQLLPPDLSFSINLLPPLSGLVDQSECVTYVNVGQMSNVCNVCLLWQIKSRVKCCCPVFVLQTCWFGNLTFDNRHLLNVAARWRFHWDENCCIRKEGHGNCWLWWSVFLLHLMQQLRFWMWNSNTGTGTKWTWRVKTLSEGCWNNIVQLSCQKIKKQTRNRVYNPAETLHVTFYSALPFYAVAFFSRICFRYIKSVFALCGTCKLWCSF